MFAHQSVQPAVKALDDFRRAGDRPPEIEGHIRHRNAERLGRTHERIHFRRPQQRLGRNATAMQTRSAELVLFHQCCLHPEHRSAHSGNIAADASAEDDQIVFMPRFRHVRLPPSAKLDTMKIKSRQKQ